MHSRVSYKTVAISLLYLYSKSCVAIMQHRRATAASVLQNGISQNTKCDNMVGFSKSSHILGASNLHGLTFFHPECFCIAYHYGLFLLHYLITACCMFDPLQVMLCNQRAEVKQLMCDIVVYIY